MSSTAFPLFWLTFELVRSFMFIKKFYWNHLFFFIELKFCMYSLMPERTKIGIWEMKNKENCFFGSP